MAKRWTIWKHGQRQRGSMHGPVKRIVQDGVLLPTPQIIAVQQRPESREDKWRNGLEWSLVPGVTREQIEEALQGLRIRVRP